VVDKGSEKKLVTKEWYQCKSFEIVLMKLKTKGINEFTRAQMVSLINEGQLGENLIASFSPQKGSVAEIKKCFEMQGIEWLDIQNLTYHYSHQNPNGNYYAHKKLLTHMGGEGRDAKYLMEIL